jgi:hypothetical protein
MDVFVGELAPDMDDGVKASCFISVSIWSLT